MHFRLKFNPKLFSVLKIEQKYGPNARIIADFENTNDDLIQILETYLYM